MSDEEFAESKKQLTADLQALRAELETTRAALDELSEREETEARRSRATLKESEERLRLAIKAAGMGIWDWDIINDRVTFSEELLQLRGLSASAAPHSFEDVLATVDAADRQRFQEAVQGALEKGEEFALEFRVRRPDGTQYWSSSRAVVRRDERGRPVRMIGVSRDVTERKRAEDERIRAEAEVRRLNAELERRVADRTAQLQAANAELEAFSYSVSHDLRAPLRHIIGFATLLQTNGEQPLSSTQTRQLETIVNAAKRMGVLIEDLLSFSRMGRRDIQHTKASLNLIVEEARQELREEEAGRKVVWQIEPLPEIECDPSMMRVVFVNLLGNALKYSRTRAEARIEVGCRADESGWSFFVRDNGVGFDMQYAQKLFGVFQRLHGEDEFEGTGIGLATVRRIIHRHGGRTWAEGKPGEGATFHFSLPKSAH